MIKEARGLGYTIDEAKEDAIAKLNASVDEDIQFEVIATPKKKKFGLFGGCKAEVRAFVVLPDEKPKTTKNPVKKSTPKQDIKGQPQNSAKSENKDTNRVAKKEAKQTMQEPKNPSVQPDHKITDTEFGESVDSSKLDPNSRAARAVAYLNQILSTLGCSNIEIKVAEKENAALISLNGEGLGVIIGHRGETLDSIQYLTGLAANNGGGYYKVSLNIGDYRQKREQTLISLAKRVSEQVLATGKCRSLEPMNPYERRIIHTAVQDIEGVVSSSFGEGNGRRVVIGVVGGELRPQRHDDRSRRHDGRGNNQGRTSYQRRSSSTVESATTREPKKDSDTPLYGKIS